MLILKILLADDNKQITSILSQYALKEGYEVIISHDGDDAFLKFKDNKIDIALLDVMMPKKDGFELCKEIRAISNIPIIMITARGEDFEKIMGLEIGADDYIVKPFSPAEVMARVKAILRRIVQDVNITSNILKIDTLVIDIEKYIVSIDNNLISLTKKEIELLWTLANNKNKVFSRDNLLDSIWGQDYFGDNRTVDSHIKRLRAKLDEYTHKTWTITTIWGVGYKLEVKS